MELWLGSWVNLSKPTLMWIVVQWSMHEELQRKTGLQDATVILIRCFMYKQT